MTAPSYPLEIPSNVRPPCYAQAMKHNEGNGMYKPEMYVCCYCSNEVPDQKVCYGCGEYKSVMTVSAYEEYLGVKWEE